MERIWLTLVPKPSMWKMSCKETIRLICEFLDGRLVPSVARDIQQHLDNCKDCRIVLDAARRTLEINFDYEPAQSLPQKRYVA